MFRHVREIMPGGGGTGGLLPGKGDIMTLYDFFRKVHNRWICLHTRIVSKALGAYGGGGRIEYPFEANHPERVFLGKNPLIVRGAFFSCVTNWLGKEYDGKIIFGDDVLIREDVQISAAASISIGSGTSVGRNSVILDHFHNLMEVGLPPAAQPLTKPRPVVIEENCYLGAHVMVGPGVRIGKGSIIGFGCAVLRDVPPYSMLVNDPANIVRQYNEEEQCWQTLRFSRDRVDKSRKKARCATGAG